MTFFKGRYFRAGCYIRGDRYVRGSTGSKKNQRYFQIAVTFRRGVGVLLSEHFSFYDHHHTSDLGVGWLQYKHANTFKMDFGQLFP